MTSVTIGSKDTHVLLRNNDTGRVAQFTWNYALSFGALLRTAARGLGNQPESCGPLRIVPKGDDVLLEELGGRMFLLAPKSAVLAMANAITGKARIEEEHFYAEAVALDDALLQRLGIPIGLAATPEVKKIAGKEAAWNAELRKWIPSSSNLALRQVGIPGVRQHEQHQGH